MPELPEIETIKNVIEPQIKGLTMEKSVVAGIGNIYSDEILFQANIRPARPANHITAEEWRRLAAEIPKCLSYFIEKNRITPEEYLVVRQIK